MLIQPVTKTATVAGKVVPVHAYTRFRLGKLEWVCAHFRHWPR
jgi:hypothetical protein